MAARAQAVMCPKAIVPIGEHLGADGEYGQDPKAISQDLNLNGIDFISKRDLPHRRLLFRCLQKPGSSFLCSHFEKQAESVDIIES
jgi:hypothetical protein